MRAGCKHSYTPGPATVAGYGTGHAREPDRGPVNYRDADDECFAIVEAHGSEVLKRAGIIMACTAWETYVEDRVLEALHARLGAGTDGFQSQFMLRQLRLALKQ